MEESALLAQKCEVPNGVKHALHLSLRPSVVLVGSDEEVLFCEPPRLRNAFSFYFVTWALSSHALIAWLGLYLFDELGYAVGYCIWLISLFFVIIYIYKWEFFAYRVVTNYRAAMVIPRRKWFCVSGVLSSYFSHTLTLISKGRLKTKIFKNFVSISKISFFAELVYGEGKEGREGRGKAIVNGDPYSLPFGSLDDIQRFEEAIGNGIKSFLNENKSLRNQYKVRTEDTPEEANLERNARMVIAVASTVAFFVLVALGTVIALEDDLITGIICMADLAISVLLFGYSCITFVKGQYVRKIFMGKCYYFSK